MVACQGLSSCRGGRSAAGCSLCWSSSKGKTCAFQTSLKIHPLALISTVFFGLVAVTLSVDPDYRWDSRRRRDGKNVLYRDPTDTHNTKHLLSPCIRLLRLLGSSPSLVRSLAPVANQILYPLTSPRAWQNANHLFETVWFKEVRGG